LGTIVTKWSCNYLFKDELINKIYLYTNDDNAGAYSLYERCGFILEGTLREHKSQNGVFVNRRLYGLLRSDWMKLTWRKDNVSMNFNRDDY
jgi:RimJ/RimL family protein N-acetyltransferase